MKHRLLIALVTSVTSLVNSSYGQDFTTNGIDTLPNNSKVQHYIPFPCSQGIDLKKIYGYWRSIGDEYNDATFKYWVIIIDTSGNWIFDKVDHGTITHKRISKLKAINNKNNTVQVENKAGVITFSIRIVTDSCFEFVNTNGKTTQVWHLNRMKSYAPVPNRLLYKAGDIGIESIPPVDTYKLENVSLIRLIANPEKYNGKRIQVVGYLHLEFEGDAIYLHEEDYRHALLKNSFDVSFSDQLLKQKVLATYNKSG